MYRTCRKNHIWGAEAGFDTFGRSQATGFSLLLPVFHFVLLSLCNSCHLTLPVLLCVCVCTALISLACSSLTCPCFWISEVSLCLCHFVMCATQRAFLSAFLGFLPPGFLDLAWFFFFAGSCLGPFDLCGSDTMVLTLARFGQVSFDCLDKPLCLFWVSLVLSSTFFVLLQTHDGHAQIGCDGVE